jgi:hypothetical protein
MYIQQSGTQKDVQRNVQRRVAFQFVSVWGKIMVEAEMTNTSIKA